MGSTRTPAAAIPPPPRTRRWLLIAGLHLFGLAGFAVAQPLFDVLARHPAFFVAHEAAPLDLVLLAAVVVVAPPLALWFAVAAGRLISLGLGSAVLGASLAGATAAVVLPVLTHKLELAAVAAVPVALTCGIGFAVLYFRTAPLRSFASLMGLAPLIFVALFLGTDPVARLVRGTPDFRAAAATIEADVPIVMVVLDEFGVTSLLDASSQKIDDVRFPNFAALAEASTWYANARAVHTSTIHAVPAILTGRFPEPELLPWAADYPESLFSLLAGSYEMHVSESETMLFSDPVVSSRRMGPGALPSLLHDASFVYLHVLLPESWSGGLPSIRNAWGRVARPREEDLAVFGRKAVLEGFVARRERFRAFIRDVGRCDQRCFHFMHILLPHRPWDLLPSTRRYSPWTAYALGKQEQWATDAWRVDQGHQQHLLQVGATDTLLGELMERMRSTGAWDRALFVVLADHGVSFWEGESMRWLDGSDHPEDLIRIPLFIKAPGQREGRIVREPTLTVDVLPIMAAHLGVDLPWSVDGCVRGLASSPACAESEARERIMDRHDEFQPVPGDLLQRRATFERRQALFGSRDASLYAFGPHRDLVGQKTAALFLGELSSFVARFDRRAGQALERDPGGASLARITAHLRPTDGARSAPDERVIAAIAVNGVIEAIAPAYPGAAGSLLVSALVPESTLLSGDHSVAAYVLSESSSEDEAEPRAKLKLAGETRFWVP
jgi:hypothetical protein